MNDTFANNAATIALLTRIDPSHSSAIEPSLGAPRSGLQPFFEEIAEMLGRLHATHAALRAAQYRISQLVQTNLMLERHARALAEEVDSARRRALHDPLTGLANRSLLADRLKQAILHARREERHMAVILLDLDGFKAVNDIHGHTVGDEVLCETARRTLGSIRACDTACRFGGDEFVVVLSNIDKREDAEAVAEKIRAEIAKPLALGERTLAVTATLGMSLYPTDGRTADELVERADRAMYGTRSDREGTRSAAGAVHTQSPLGVNPRSQLPP